MKTETTIFIAGGTGFIGQHLLRALKNEGYKTRCLVRTKARATGFIDSAEAIVGDITDKASLKGALNGIDMVVHLVGIIEDKGDMTFERVHVEGTMALVAEAKVAGVKHFFYQSALGADLKSPARYQSTKAEAEEIVRGSGIHYIIFRPSLVIGKTDGFTEKLKELINLGPVVAVPGNGKARFQPIYIDDWVRCFLSILNNKDAIGRTYEFGGPEQLTYNEILSQLISAMGLKRNIVHLPLSLVRAGLPFMGLSQKIGKALGKNIPSVTAEQLYLLGTDNICDINSVEKSFGFSPISYKEALKKFIPL